MENIIPASEGFVTLEQYEAAKKEVRDFVVPLLDGTDLNEGIMLSGELFQAVMEIKSLDHLDNQQRALLLGSILESVLGDVIQDLVVRYADEGPSPEGAPAS